MDLKHVLIAEDDEDDFELMKDAWARCCPEAELVRVADGVELLDYLETSPPPDIIFLDLNMPRVDGREALMKLKSADPLREIPVIILTTSNNREDVQKCYRLGANSYLRKPGGFQELTAMLSTVHKYWFETALLPKE